MPTTGEFLRQVREAKGMSLRALSERAGTSFSYLQRLETNGVSPSVATLARICQVYGVETFEAVAGMSRLEMIRQTLGPVPLDDPAVRQMLLLAARPDGPAQIREMLALAQSDPAQLRQALLMIEQLRKLNLLKE